MNKIDNEIEITSVNNELSCDIIVKLCELLEPTTAFYKVNKRELFSYFLLVGHLSKENEIMSRFFLSSDYRLLTKYYAETCSQLKQRNKGNEKAYNMYIRIQDVKQKYSSYQHEKQ